MSAPDYVERFWLKIFGLATLVFAYFPARFVWDNVGIEGRIAWAFVAFCVLTGFAAMLFIASWRRTDG